jgi:hypothetical protein
MARTSSVERLPRSSFAKNYNIILLHPKKITAQSFPVLSYCYLARQLFVPVPDIWQKS